MRHLLKFAMLTANHDQFLASSLISSFRIIVRAAVDRTRLSNKQFGVFLVVLPCLSKAALQTTEAAKVVTRRLQKLAMNPAFNQNLRGASHIIHTRITIAVAMHASRLDQKLLFR